MFFFFLKKRRHRRRSVPLPQHEYSTGELYYVWGRPYTLEVFDSVLPGIFVQGEHLRIGVDQKSTASQREKMLDAWLRKLLDERLLTVVEQSSKIVGRQPSSYYIRKMKTRWGTCNVKTGRVCINLRLAHLQPEFLDYIVIHELNHLWERGHGEAFKANMDRFYPNWREKRRQLRSAMKEAF